MNCFRPILTEYTLSKFTHLISNHQMMRAQCVGKLALSRYLYPRPIHHFTRASTTAGNQNRCKNENHTIPINHLRHCSSKQMYSWSNQITPIPKNQLLHQGFPACATISTSCRYDNKENDSKEEEKTTEKFQYKNWGTLLTIPNLLTMSRVVLTPYLGHLVLCESYPAACAIFIYAGITDVLDGYIARRFPSQASPAGSFMDPLADKFLGGTLFITLTMVNLIPAPLTCLVVARDVLLVGAAFYVRTISIPPPVTLGAIFDISHQTAEIKPTLISKANTAIQLGLVAVTLAAPVMNFVDHPALHALWYLTAVTTIWSGIGYVFAKDTFKIYKQRKSK